MSDGYDARQLMRQALKALQPIFDGIPLRLVVQSPRNGKHFSVATEGFEGDPPSEIIEVEEDPWFKVYFLVGKDIMSDSRQAAYFKIIEDKLIFFSIMNRQITAYNKWTNVFEITGEEKHND